MKYLASRHDWDVMDSNVTKGQKLCQSKAFPRNVRKDDFIETIEVELLLTIFTIGLSIL